MPESQQPPFQHPSSIEDQPIQYPEADEQSLSVETPTSEVTQYVEFSGVNLPKGSGQEQYVPPKMPNYIYDSFSSEMLNKMAVAASLNQPALFEGGTSLGKSTATRHMAAEMDWSFHSINMTGTSDVEAMMGRYTPNSDRKTAADPEYIFSDGPVVAAVREASQGHQVMLVIDEINAATPNILIRLHEVLDQIEKGGQITLTEDASERLQVIRENIRVIALANPPSRGSSKYAGREPLDEAQLRRWVYHKLPDELPRDSLEFSTEALFNLQPNKARSEEQTPGTTYTALTPEEMQHVPGMKELVSRYLEFHTSAKALVEKQEIGRDQPQSFNFDHREEPRRVMEYFKQFYQDDATQTFQDALKYYYVNKVASEADRRKLEDLISTVQYTPTTDHRRKGLNLEDPENRDMPRRYIELDQLYQRDVYPRELLPSLAGDNSAGAEELRKRWGSEPGTHNALGRSYAGVNTKAAEDWRNEQLVQKRYTAFAHSLTGMEDGFQMQQRVGILMTGNEADKKAVITSLAGCNSDAAWDLRRQYVTIYPQEVARSLTGIDTEDAYVILETICDYRSPDNLPAPLKDALLSSRAGLNSSESNTFRYGLVYDPRYTSSADLYAYLSSLAGVDSPEAWSLRSDYIGNRSCHNAIAQSLSGLDNEQSWKMRELLKYHGASAEIYAKSLSSNWIVAAVKANHPEAFSEAFTY